MASNYKGRMSLTMLITALKSQPFNYLDTMVSATAASKLQYRMRAPLPLRYHLPLPCVTLQGAKCQPFGMAAELLMKGARPVMVLNLLWLWLLASHNMITFTSISSKTLQYRQHYTVIFGHASVSWPKFPCSSSLILWSNLETGTFPFFLQNGIPFQAFTKNDARPRKINLEQVSINTYRYKYEF